MISKIRAWNKDFILSERWDILSLMIKCYNDSKSKAETSSTVSTCHKKINVCNCLLWKYNKACHRKYNIKPTSSNRSHLFLGARPFWSCWQRRFGFAIITMQLHVELYKRTKIDVLNNLYHFNYLQFKAHFNFFLVSISVALFIMSMTSRMNLHK